MQFKIINETGEVDLVFSWKERFILFFGGKIHFTAFAFKKFGNSLVDIVYGYHKYCPDFLNTYYNIPEEGKKQGTIDPSETFKENK
jgi:hypothetical protein